MTRLLRRKSKAPDPEKIISVNREVSVTKDDVEVTQTTQSLSDLNAEAIRINCVPPVQTSLKFIGAVTSKYDLTKANLGDIVYCKDTEETFVYTGDNWDLICSGVPEGEPESQENKKIIPFPEKCKYCGASLHDYICEYCGTEYPKYSVEE